MYIKILFWICLKDKRIKNKKFICANIYFAPLYIYIL